MHVTLVRRHNLQRCRHILTPLGFGATEQESGAPMGTPDGILDHRGRCPGAGLCVCQVRLTATAAARTAAVWFTFGDPHAPGALRSPADTGTQTASETPTRLLSVSGSPFPGWVSDTSPRLMMAVKPILSHWKLETTLS